ncbi:MAG: type II CRISPR RNA-guided endonuclease Cas9 [Brevinema sp.]
MKKDYVLGLDLGTNSIGWACIDIENKEIISGVRIFDAAENPKDGKSLAEPRRTARLTRRRLYRRWVRLQKTVELLKKYMLIFDPQDVQSPFESNIWELRVKALDEALESKELSRVIYHIVKARGFKSSRKDAGSVDQELGKANEAMKILVDDFEESKATNNSRTIGEYLYQTYGLAHKNIRNKFSNYNHLIKQDLNEEELRLILEIQKEKGNSLITDEFVNELLEIFNYRKGLPSFESKVAKCELEPKYRRAPKDSISASLFRAWNDLNNLRIATSENNSPEPLSLEKRKKLIDLAFEKAKEDKKVTEAQIKSILEVATIRRENDKGKEEVTYLMNLEMKKIVNSLNFSSYIKLSHVLKENNLWENIQDDIHTLDAIIYVIGYLKEFKNFNTLEDKVIKDLIDQLNWESNIWETLFDSLSFDGTMGHSLQAMWQILPYLQLEEIYTYDKALEEVYPNSFNNRDSQDCKYIPKFDEDNFTNPVVRRTLNQSRLLINKLISLYGKPKQINIELARGLGKSKSDRDAIDKEMKANRDKNEQYYQLSKEHNIQNSIMYRLWKEQDCQCVYSGRQIGIEDLQFNRVEIDHILPLSRSGDDSLMNKVLVFSSENQQKGNQTAFEYLELKGNDQLEKYKIRIRSIKTLLYPKKERLLLENFDERKSQEYKSRHLNDTRYIAKALSQHIDKSIRPSSQKFGYVQTIAGRATTTLRKLWNMATKNREESHKHHALDAILIAGIGDSIKNWERLITTASHYKNQGIKPTDNIIHNIEKFGFDIPKPWENFTKDAIESVDKVFVSRMGKRKVTGAMHKETIKSRRSDGKVIKTIRLHEIDKKEWNEESVKKILDKMIDKNRNQRVYNTILEHAKKFDWKMAEAFSNENAPDMPTSNIPKSDGSEKIVPKIRRIKIYDSASSALQLPKISSDRRKAAIDSGDIVRLDLFRNVKGKFFTVPVYSFHYNFLPEPSEPAQFIFSIYKNDYLTMNALSPFIVLGKSLTHIEGYWSTNQSAIQTVLMTHDQNQKYSVTVSKMNQILKYHINILGEKHFIASSDNPEEKRLSLKEVEQLWKQKKNL